MGVLNTEATRDPGKDENKVRVRSLSYLIVLLCLLSITAIYDLFQITITVPVTLMDVKSESGQDVFPVKTIHKIFTSISSNVEDVSFSDLFQRIL